MVRDAGVISTILSCYKGLSESERHIADFILSQRETVSSFTAGEIASKSGTSNTTVSRFVRTIGYGSFSQLRIALAREEVAKEEPFDASGGISLADVPGSVRYVLDMKVEELGATAKTLDAGRLAMAVGLIKRAGTVLVCGAGSSLEYAQLAATKLAQVGVRAVAPGTTESAALLALTLTDTDCVLVISNSGTSRALRPILSNAQDAAAPTIMVTAHGSTAMASRTDCVLEVANRDYLLANDFDFSYNSINFVMETIVLLLLHELDDAGEYLRMFDKTGAHEDVSGGSSVEDGEQGDDARR